MPEQRKIPLARRAVAILAAMCALTVVAIDPSSATVDDTTIRQLTSAASGLTLSHYDTIQPLQNGVLFASFNALGNELAFSDGTPDGTGIVLDINEGSASSTPSNITPLISGDQAVFLANDGTHGNEPWITDGTEAGTRLLIDLEPGPMGSGGAELVAFGDDVLLAASTGTGGQLWLLGQDGNATLLQTFATGRPDQLYAHGGRAAFRVSESSAAREVWVTDGTPTGTTSVSGVDSDSNVWGFVAVGDSFVFTTVNDDRTAAGLFGINFSTRAAELLAPDVYIDITPTEFNSHYFEDQRVAFVNLVDIDNSSNTWRTDGTPQGTRALQTNPQLFGGLFFTELGNGQVFFGGYAEGTNGNPWITDGTEAGTHMVTDLGTQERRFAPFGQSAATANEAVFTVTAGESTFEIWASDGTADGTRLLSTTAGAQGGVLWFSFTAAANNIFFAGPDISSGGFGDELWAISDVPDPPTESQCADLSPTVEGTDADDVLFGTNGPDIIFGYGGNDRIYGLGDDDIICGGPGNDRIFGGAGDNTLIGGDGIDKMRAGPGQDQLFGGPDTDFLKGGPGNDTIEGEAGDDRVRGSFGDDTISGGTGNDRLWGGPGNDTIDGGAGNDLIKGSDGTDTCNGGPDIDAAHPTCETVASVP